MRTPFTGCGTALVTPFTSSGAVDEAAVRRLAKRQVEAGVHFLVPCGTTGEAPTLSAAERSRVVEIVVDEAAGRVPVLAGAGGYDTREVALAARAMQAAGAAGLLGVAAQRADDHRQRRFDRAGGGVLVGAQLLGDLAGRRPLQLAHQVVDERGGHGDGNLPEKWQEQ